MYRKDREERSERAKSIVEKYSIRTQQNFADKYKEEYNEEISQTTAYRIMTAANISVDSETGLYKYNATPYEFPPSEDELFFHLLDNYSEGTYTHDKENKAFYLSVEHGYEEVIAENIYNYCAGKVTILYGFSCLFIRCCDIATKQKLAPVLKLHKSRR